MRVLLTNNTLKWRTGTELYVLDVARRLNQLGHEPVAYSPHLGEVAEVLARAGVRVVRNLLDLPFRPDIIHGHHHIETMTALASLPAVPAIYFCHGSEPWQEMPPVFPRILRYVAVDEVCRERIVREARIPFERIQLLLNFVDTDVFLPRQPLPSRPLRALVFSNNASEENYAAAVRAACHQCGVTVETRGLASGNPANEPQELLQHYDIVFAKARAAIEALAVGCAVVLLDAAGLGPMVTTANFTRLRPNNFGFRTLVDEPTVENIVRAIQTYDAADAARVRDLVRSEANLSDAVTKMIRMYGEVIAENGERASDSVAELQAMGAYLQTLTAIIKTELYGLQKPFRMEPLTASASAQVRLINAKISASLAQGYIWVQCEVTNGTSQQIGSYHPAPIHLSYHWFDMDGNVTIFEGLRSQLIPPLDPGSSEIYELKIAPPPDPGEYRLRITLVQEGVRWFDELLGAAASQEISIRVP